MTSPTFRNSQLGNTIRTEKPSLFVGSSGIVFTDGSQQLTAFTGTATESDPIFTSSTAYSITATDTGNWNTSFSWGDHASIGYATTGELVAVSGYLQNQINNIPEDTNTFISGVIYNDSSRKIILLRNDNIALTGDLSSVLQSGDPISLLNNDLAYITGFTETDPIFITSVAYNISATQTGEWSLAYGWGNHASFDYATNSGLVVVSGYLQNQIDNISDIYVTGITFNSGDGNLTLYLNNATNLSDNFDGRYLQSYTETDPTISGYIKTITSLQISQWDESYSVLAAQSGNWNAAYGWGDHANVGYLQSGDNISLLNNDIGYLTAADVSGIAGNGTTNYISKWSSSNSLTDSVIYDNGTNVGIGTASPLSKLHVRDTTDSDCQITVDNGTARAKLQTLSNIGYAGTITDHDFILRANNTDSIKLSNSSANNIVVVNPVANDQDFRVRGTTETNLIYVDAGANNVGIGIGVPTQRLHVYEAGNAQVLVDDGTVKTKVQSLAGQSKGIVGTNSNHDLEFRTNNNGKMIIKAGGDVGIGTASPNTDTKMEVSYDATSGPYGIMVTKDGQETTDGVVLGDCLGTTYQGLSHVTQDPASFEYMIISQGDHTLISANSGYDAIIRAGANSTNYQLRIKPASAEFGSTGDLFKLNSAGAIFNDGGAAVDFRVEGDADPYLLFVKGAGGADKVGVGTSLLNGKFNVYYSTTDNSFQYGIHNSANHYTTTGGTNYVFGNYTDVRKHVASGVTDTGYVMGHECNALLSDEGSLASAFGLRTYAGINNQSDNGNLTNAYGVQSRVINYSQGTGNINTARGIDVYINGDLDSPGNGGITNAYGVYIQSILNSTNTYGIYQVGSSDKNYFAGDVGIGTATPQAKLDVNGTVEFDDLVRWEYPDKALDTTTSTLGYMRLYDEAGAYCGLGVSTSNFNIGSSGLINVRTVVNAQDRLILRTNGSNTLYYGDGQELDITKSTDTADGLRLGDIYGNNTAYQGLSHASFTSNSSYMIMSEGTSTLISADTGGSVFIRGGPNYSTNEIRLYPDSNGVVVNEQGGNSDFRVEGDSDPYLLFVDASIDRVGIGTASPSYKLDVSGMGRFVHADGDCGLIVEDSGGSGIHIGDCALVNDSTYAGIKHSSHSGLLDFMLISNGTSTVLSGKDGYSTFVRAGGNDQTFQATFNDTFFGIGPNAGKFLITSSKFIANNGNLNLDLQVKGENDDNALYVDANNDKVGIGTSLPQMKLDVDGTFRANDVVTLGSGSIPLPRKPIELLNPTNISELTINEQFTFPTTDGSSGQGLITDGLGDLSWNNVIISDTTAASGSDVVNNIISLSQEEYDAITPQSGTLYAIYGSGVSVQSYATNNINTTITNFTPSSSTDFGIKGQVTYDTEYIYVCVADSRWKRFQLLTW